MKLIRCQNPTEVAEKTIALLKVIADKNTGPLRIFLPTGKTPLKIYNIFVEEKKYWSEKLLPIQIDEFIDPKRIFFEMLSAEVLRPLSLLKKTWCIRPEWSDLEMLEHVDDVLAEKIDVSLLGLGPNGHVGFHEPGNLGQAFMGGRVTITDQTRSRVPGARTNNAFTFGVGAFAKAKSVILVATGPEKKEIVKQLLERDSTPELPATLLKSHSDLTILTDL